MNAYHWECNLNDMKQKYTIIQNQVFKIKRKTFVLFQNYKIEKKKVLKIFESNYSIY